MALWEALKALPAPPGKSPFRVKGHVYRTAFAYDDQRVPGGVEAVLARVEDEELRAFFRQPFLPGGWYDVLPFVPWTWHGSRLAETPWLAFTRQGAAKNAVDDLNGVYRLLLRLASPEFLSERIVRVSAQYFDFGELRQGAASKGFYEGYRTQVPLYLFEWFCAVVEGFVPAILAASGARDVRVRWGEPVPDGARAGIETATVRFTFTWK